MRSSFPALPALVLSQVLWLGVAPGCSLGNIAHEDCPSDSVCAATFGLGSACSSGFCTTPGSCTTGHDCREQFGGGACVSGRCTSAFPTDPACTQILEPPDVLTRPTTGDGAPLVIGAIFSLAETHDQAVTTAVRLGVQDINRNGGMINGQPLGLVVCDNGGAGNAAQGDARTALNDHALDYLAGTLGVPYLVGPLTSADAITLVNRLLAQAYPTVVISPSATSPQLTDIEDRLHKTDEYGLFWRTCPSDELQGKVLALDVIGQSPALKRVAVLYIQDAYGEGLATVFGADFKGTTLSFPFTDAQLAVPAQVASYVSSVAGMQPDAVLLIAVNAGEALTLLKALAGPLGKKPFFFTDGTKDVSLLDPSLPADVRAIVKGAIGTAPADPSGANYQLFVTNLNAGFKLDASSFSFLAQAYDAAYVGAYGTVFASQNGPRYTGLDVAGGMARLSDVKGMLVDVGPTTWNTAKGLLTMGREQIDIEGTSGHLDFDARTGQAPAPVEIWSASADGKSFTTVKIINP